MKRTNAIFPLILAIVSLSPLTYNLLPLPAHAGGCFADPVYERSGQVKVVIGARVRSVACMEGSTVLKTLPVGKVVQLIGETDGWLKIRDTDGVEGWVGATLLTYTDEAITAAPTPAPTPVPAPAPIAPPEPIASAPVLSYGNDALSSAAPEGLSPSAYPSGCYVDPVYAKSHRAKITTGARLRDGACMVGTTVKRVLPVGRVVEVIGFTDGWYKVRDADGVEGWVGATLMRQTDEAVSSPAASPAAPVLPASASYKATTAVNMRSLGSLRGTILARLTSGEVVSFIKTAGGWHYIQRSNGTKGWVSATYLRKTTSPVAAAPTTPAAPVPPPTPAFSATPVAQGTIGPSYYQEGTVPTGIDLLELNRYWLSRINALRAERGLRQLVLDQRWVDTASEYAAYMGKTGATGHERADGSTMHQWIDKKGLSFTTRYSENGWKTNYFTENISWNQIEPTMADAKRALDDTIDFYLGEASYNGAHYRTIYHADWNSVGAGFYFQDLGNGRVKFYQVFHYGSLVL